MALKVEQKKKSKLPIVIVSLLALVLVCAGVYYYLAVKQQANNDNQQQQQQVSDVDSLTAEQRKIYDSYGSSNNGVKDILAILQENSWSDSKQVNSVSFSDCAYMERGESNGGNVEKRYFAVCDINKTQSSNSKSETIINITCLGTQGQYFSITLTLASVVQRDLENSADSTSQDKQIYTVSCKEFNKSQDYVQQNANGQLVISVSDDLIFAMPFEKQALVDNLSKYIKEKYPQVTKCTFSAEYYTVLMPSKAYTLYCICNNKNVTNLQVTYDEAEKKFSIEKRKTT